MRLIGFVLSVAILLSSCKKDPKLFEPVSPMITGENVLVLNEGNFQWGNASTTWINYVKHATNQDVFANINGRPLGDVLNSGTQTGGITYLVVNNSQKVERMKSPLEKAVEPITGLHSPRYVLPINNDKLYISDLYDNKIYIVNGKSQHTGFITFPGWSEQMVVAPDQSVWVCNVTGNSLVRVDTNTDAIVDSIHVGDSPKSIIIDGNNHLWVLCEGRVFPSETAGSLWCIDLESQSVIQSFTFTSTEHPTRLHKSADGSVLYYLMNGVRKLNQNDTAAPSSAFIPQGNKLFYGLGVDPQNHIWVSDAKDFVQNGDVFRYSAEGVLISSFEAGIIPSGFIFY